jgi:hypothetical protein
MGFKPLTFLNPRRLHDYPYLMLGTVSIIMIANLFFHRGWIGGLGQVIGSDFITLYSAGLIIQKDPEALYNFELQAETQQAIIAPTELPGLNPYISPPYVAQAYSVVTIFPLIWSFILWSLIMLLCTFLTIYLLFRFLPPVHGLPFHQVLVISLSFFPFIEGLQVGQNHALSMLLVTGIIISTCYNKNYLAGVLAGGLIYKPQLVIGLLIVWLVWKNFKSLATFSLIAGICIGVSVLKSGITPYQSYLQASQALLLLPYQPGFPGYLIITIYGLLATISPIRTAGFNQIISQVLLVMAGGLLAALAYRQKRLAPNKLWPVLILAIIFPLVFAPYVQLHDLILIIPCLFVWAAFEPSLTLRNIAIAVYLSAFFLTLLAALTGIAWMTLITCALFSLAVIAIIQGLNPIQPSPQ